MNEAVNPYQAPMVMDGPEEEVKDGVLVQIKSVSLRAGYTVGFLGLCMLMQVAVLLMSMGASGLQGVLRDVGGVSVGQIVLLDRLLRMIYTFWFMMWVYRSAQNAKLLDGELSDISPGMSVGSYFIPVYNLVGPFLAMRKITTVVSRVSKMHLVWAGAWWVLYLLPGIMALFLRATGVPEWINPALGLVPLVATVVLVVRLTRQQMFLYRNPPRIPRLGGSPRRHTQAPGIPNGMPLPHPKRPRLPVVALSPYRPKPEPVRRPDPLIQTESPP